MWLFEPFVENWLPRFNQKPKNAALDKTLMKNRRRLLITFVVLLGFSMLALGQAKKSDPRPEKARDPVCGIMVEKDPQLAAEYKGKTYYFCSKTDREKFKQNPQKYVKDK